jgi:hypothetical protein
MNLLIAALLLVRENSYPVWERTLVLLLGPPILSCLVWLMAGGWAQTVQGGEVSSRTKDRQRFEFWLLLGALYGGEIIIFACVRVYGIKN